MNEAQTQMEEPDEAAVFAIAKSLWSVGLEGSVNENLSELFCGYDQYMREIMAVGRMFEKWACSNIKFSEISEVWPYFLEERFGSEFLKSNKLAALAGFDDEDCLRIALKLSLPVFFNDNPQVPFFLERENPIQDSRISCFQIKTVRRCIEDGNIETYSVNDEPFDEFYDNPFIGIYGVIDGRLEHIADRNNFSSAFQLMKDLVPAIDLPDPISGTCCYPEIRSTIGEA